MASWEEVRHQVAISGTVTGSDGRGLERVRVAIVDGPADFLADMALRAELFAESWESMARRPDRLLTEVDGHFHFMDLPNGDYTLNAAFPSASRRYGTVQRTVTVARTPEGAILMAGVDMVLPQSTLRGTVTRQGAGTAVSMAEIRVDGSGEAVHSDENGIYVLQGLEASTGSSRGLTVSAVGYQSRSMTFSLTAPGSEALLDISLTPV